MDIEKALAISAAGMGVQPARLRIMVLDRNHHHLPTPDVDGVAPVMDRHEERDSGSANLDVVEAARRMLTRTIELLR